MALSCQPAVFQLAQLFCLSDNAIQHQHHRIAKRRVIRLPAQLPSLQRAVFACLNNVHGLKSTKHRNRGIFSNSVYQKRIYPKISAMKRPNRLDFGSGVFLFFMKVAVSDCLALADSELPRWAAVCEFSVCSLRSVCRFIPHRAIFPYRVHSISG